MLKRKQPFIVFAVLIVILILELLPYGAVLNFAHLSPDLTIGYYEQHVSYFDPIAYTYGNFGPFITAILTCSHLIISSINLFIGKSMHPLDCVNSIQGIHIPQKTTLSLNFEASPTSVTVRRYKLHTTNYDQYEEIPVNGNTIEIKAVRSSVSTHTSSEYVRRSLFPCRKQKGPDLRQDPSVRDY